MSKKRVKYQTKQVITGSFGRGERKVARLIAKGWEVASTTRYGFSNNKVILRRAK